MITKIVGSGQREKDLPSTIPKSSEKRKYVLQPVGTLKYTHGKGRNSEDVGKWLLRPSLFILLDRVNEVSSR